MLKSSLWIRSIPPYFNVYNQNIRALKNFLLTASGGRFRDSSIDEMNETTVDEALKHPNWEMGAKITIDSSTLMNKGLEVIEAKWLLIVM